MNIRCVCVLAGTDGACTLKYWLLSEPVRHSGAVKLDRTDSSCNRLSKTFAKFRDFAQTFRTPFGPAWAMVDRKRLSATSSLFIESTVVERMCKHHDKTHM